MEKRILCVERLAASMTLGSISSLNGIIQENHDVKASMSGTQKVESFTRYTTVRLAAGELLFAEGELGDCMYLVRSGRVAIQKNSSRGLITISVLEEGDFFGEMSLLESQPRYATARAETDCVLSRIDMSDFEQLIQSEPELAVRMLRKLGWQLRSLTEKYLALRQQLPQAAPQSLPEDRETWPGVLLEPAGFQTDPKLDPVAVKSASSPEYGLRLLSGYWLPLPDQDVITLGRTDPASGIFPDLDLSEHDPRRSLSRRHARMVRTAEGYALMEEMGVMNGSFVNGNRLQPQQLQLLQPGDRITLGMVQLLFDRLPPGSS